MVLLATQLCRTPVALVTLVASDRQWFKARVGFAPGETPLAQSVCAHSLRQPGLLVIPDIAQDPRTRDNALVTGEPFIRFYAGARLETPEGVGIGTLCVIDTEPRPEGLTEAQAEVLEALGRQVMAQLGLRRAVTEREAAALRAGEAETSRSEAGLRASEARQAFVGELGERVLALAPYEDPSFVAAELLGRTLGVSRVGFGTIDPDRETLRVSRDHTAPGVESLAGTLQLRDYGSFVDNLKAGEVVTIADVREDPRTAPAAAAAALEGRSARSFANVPALEKGRLVAVMFVNHAEPRDWTDDDVALLRLCAERTRAAVERAHTEAELRELAVTLEARVAERTAELTLYRNVVESDRFPICADDAGHRVTAFNKAYADDFLRVIGRPQRLGEVLPDLFPPEQAAALRAFAERALAGETFTIEADFGDPDLTVPHWELDFAPVRDEVGRIVGAFHHARDVTERLRAAAELGAIEEQLRQSQKMEAAHRGLGARLQQPARGHLGEPGGDGHPHRPRPAGGRGPLHGGGPGRGQARRRAHPAASGLLAPSDAHAQSHERQRAGRRHGGADRPHGGACGRDRERGRRRRVVRRG